MIYFFWPKGSSFVKIGYARSVRSRRKDCQTHHPEKIRVIGVLPGTGAKENEIHRKLAHLRIRAEWFRYTLELEEFIKRHCERYQPNVHEPMADSAPLPAIEAKLDIEETVEFARELRDSPALHRGKAKRICVWLQPRSDRPHFTLDWIDPDTRKRKSKSSGTMNSDVAELRRADLESHLNQKYLEIIGRSTPRSTVGVVCTDCPNEVDASPIPGDGCR
jgi:hypothetical protein